MFTLRQEVWPYTQGVKPVRGEPPLLTDPVFSCADLGGSQGSWPVKGP